MIYIEDINSENLYLRYKSKGQKRIRINKSSLPHLIDLIKIYVIPSMNYKVGFNLSFNEIETFIET